MAGDGLPAVCFAARIDADAEERSSATNCGGGVCDAASVARKGLSLPPCDGKIRKMGHKQTRIPAGGMRVVKAFD
jgi:hypothetical protein